MDEVADLIKDVMWMCCLLFSGDNSRIFLVVSEVEMPLKFLP
jgi:hypothetical protein